MNEYAWQGSGLLAIVTGILICFWGYRLLKLSLAVIGFIAGAYGGWQVGLALAPGNGGALLVCALVGGLVGMGLCLWLYLLGVFLIGATAGAVIAGATVHGTTGQAEPLISLILPLIFGIIAVAAQKVMVNVSTGLSGAYLITAGIWPFIAGGPGSSPIWFQSQRPEAPGTLGYAALGIWVLLALAGISFQLRGGRRQVEVAAQQA
jgi:hypothetical protein